MSHTLRVSNSKHSEFFSWHHALLENVQLWRVTFWQTWESLPFYEKLIWIVFVGQTTAIITLLEYFLLKL